MGLKYMNKYIEALRDLVNGKQPSVDISEMLYNHNCTYLLSKITSSNSYNYKLKIENILNKICIVERYETCAQLFNTFNQHNIPYAVIKGAVLSNSAYLNPFCRHSGDIDLLVNRNNIDKIKEILYNAGFIQGRVTENGIEPFSRKELLFQSAMSHQTAPFVKKTNNKLCPYVNVDINLDIMWGESGQSSDMDFVLEKTESAKINDIAFKKLSAEMEFISLCLHHYKDMNSIYLLYERGLKLSHFCDIYFYIKNCNINPNILYDYCSRLNVSEYIYYCLFYVNLIFEDSELERYLSLLHSEKAHYLIDKFGLNEKERQIWNIDFYERLFDIDIRDYLENSLTEELLNKIKTNQMFM